MRPIREDESTASASLASTRRSTSSGVDAEDEVGAVGGFIEGVSMTVRDSGTWLSESLLVSRYSSRAGRDEIRFEFCPKAQCYAIYIHELVLRKRARTSVRLG